MKTSFALLTAAVLGLSSTAAFARDGHHGGGHRGHHRSEVRVHHYDHGGHHGYPAPRVERHYYHHYDEARPVHYPEPIYYYREQSHHHNHHDLFAILGGAILVNEVLHH